jgi:hypothetical protein
MQRGGSFARRSSENQAPLYIFRPGMSTAQKVCVRVRHRTRSVSELGAGPITVEKAGAEWSARMQQPNHRPVEFRERHGPVLPVGMCLKARMSIREDFPAPSRPTNRLRKDRHISQTVRSRRASGGEGSLGETRLTNCLHRCVSVHGKEASGLSACPGRWPYHPYRPCLPLCSHDTPETKQG